MPTGLLKQRNILLVDDDTAVRESLAHALSLENYSVISAGSSREALSVFSAQNVDLAILDLNLGCDDSGWDLLENLIQLAGTSARLPIIIISARADALQNPRSGSAAVLLPKPLDIPTVIHSINTCFSTQN